MLPQNIVPWGTIIMHYIMYLFPLTVSLVKNSDQEQNGGFWSGFWSTISGASTGKSKDWNHLRDHPRSPYDSGWCWLMAGGWLGLSARISALGLSMWAGFPYNVMTGFQGQVSKERRRKRGRLYLSHGLGFRVTCLVMVCQTPVLWAATSPCWGSDS